MKSIRNLKPKKKGKKNKYKQGYFRIDESKKFIGKEPPIYRSSYEYKFMCLCEKHPNIIKWDSEPFPIEYIGEDGKKHHYWIDFLIQYRNGDKYLIEVKPYSQTLSTDKSFGKNSRKWNAAIEFAEKNGMKFKIITERSLKI